MKFFSTFFISRVVQNFARNSAFIKWVMRKLYKASVRPGLIPFQNLNSNCKKNSVLPLPPHPTFAPLLPFNPPNVCPFAPLPPLNPPPLNNPAWIPPPPPPPPHLNPHTPPPEPTPPESTPHLNPLHLNPPHLNPLHLNPPHLNTLRWGGGEFVVNGQTLGGVMWSNIKISKLGRKKFNWTTSNQRHQL